MPEEKPGGGGIGCRVRVEWTGWEDNPGLEAGGLSCLGGDPRASEGAEWALERIAQGLDRGLGSSSEEEVEDSTIRE